MKIARIIMTAIIFIGVALLVYPTVSAFIADYTSTKVIVDYQKQMDNMKKQELEQKKKEAKEFNSDLSEINISGVSKKKKSENKKNDNTSKKSNNYVFEQGEMIGYITIDKINVNLPIYEGTHEAVLYKGIGHISTSSLPLGGKGTHSVLTGHSGLSSAILFSNLEQLQNNDIFYINYLDEVLAYKVDSINTVEPDKSDPYIKMEKNKDYVTLVTCVPKTVNTHRLLVRGKRIPYTPKDSPVAQIKAKETHNNLIMYICIASIVITVLFVIILIFKKKRKKVQ